MVAGYAERPRSASSIPVAARGWHATDRRLCARPVARVLLSELDELGLGDAEALGDIDDHSSRGYPLPVLDLAQVGEREPEGLRELLPGQ